MALPPIVVTVVKVKAQLHVVERGVKRTRQKTESSIPTCGFGWRQSEQGKTVVISP